MFTFHSAGTSRRTAIWSPSWERVPGIVSTPWVRLQIAALGALIYNPRLQTDIISLCAKMPLWFFFKFILAPKHCLWDLSSATRDRSWVLRCESAAAAAAKSLQSCPALCDPIDGSPPGSPVPGILQARTLEWVTISFSNA